MSIDFEVTAEAKAIREKVRKWVQEEGIPRRRNWTPSRSPKLGRCAKRPERRGCGARSCLGKWRQGIGTLANALVQMELGGTHARGCR